MAEIILEEGVTAEDLADRMRKVAFQFERQPNTAASAVKLLSAVRMELLNMECAGMIGPCTGVPVAVYKRYPVVIHVDIHVAIGAAAMEAVERWPGIWKRLL